MKASIKKGHQIGDFILKFNPKSISFSKQPANIMKIYLQKNVQVIGEIDQYINTHQQLKKYQFQREIAPVQFRIASLKNCQYQICLYELLDDQTEKLVTSASVNFSAYLKRFQGEFKRFEDKLQSEVREKVNETLPDLWKNIKLGFDLKMYSYTVQFSSIKASFQFQLVPHHQYDQMVRLAELERQKVTQKMVKNNFIRTSTLPTSPKVMNSLNNIRKTAGQKMPSALNPTDGHKLERSKTAIKEHFSNFSKKFDSKELMNISEKDGTEDLMNSQGQGANSDKIGKFEMEALEIDDQLENEELQAAGVLPQKYKAEQPQNMVQEFLKGKDIIGTGQQRNLLLTPETTMPSNLGMVSLKSHDTAREQAPVSPESSSKLKEYLLTFFLTVIGGFMLVFLMHPIAKID